MKIKIALPLIIPLFFFLASLFFLHQKVQIYVEAYCLSNSHSRYNELVDKRDYLMYNFAKEVSLAKVNHWAKDARLVPAGKDRYLVLNTPVEDHEKTSRVASIVNRFLRTSASTSTVLAEDKR